MSKLSFALDGYGVAYEQSVSPGTTVDSSEQITIRFRNINYTEPEKIEEITDDVTASEEEG